MHHHSLNPTLHHMGNMKVHQFARGLWKHELTLGCKRLRPLAPKLPNTDTTFDLKSFIKPQNGPPKLSSDDNNNNNRDHSSSPHVQLQVETLPGGTRWNPTQEQIGILEMLYRGGMRTPNAQQIEQITVQLGKYGKIEGKNVFYWFQNHKARERQKQKRNSRALSHHTPPITRTPSIHTTTNFDITITRGGVVGVEVERDGEDSPYKKCRRWVFECMEEKSRLVNKEEEEHRTLELFPLHPEGRSK